MKPQIKICGITNFEDAKVVSELGGSFVGLNFFGDSPRFLEDSDAMELANEIKSKLPNLKLVGVFVDEEKERVDKLSEVCELDVLQFHGNENLDFCLGFAKPVWKAFRVKDESSLEDLQEFLSLDGIVLDAYKKGFFGGSAQTFDWELIHQTRDEIPFFILSGGINPSNVGKAIKQLQPNIVDIASGVEEAHDKRKKSLEKLKSLFEEVEKAS